MFLTIFVEKSFFFRSKKNFDPIFFQKLQKKIKNDFTRWKQGSNCEKSRNLGLVGASPTEWWLKTHGIGLKNNLYLYFLTNKQKINPFFHFLVHAQIKVNQVMKLTSVFMYSFLMSIFVLSFCKSCCPTFLYEPSTNNVHSYGQILLQ